MLSDRSRGEPRISRGRYNDPRLVRTLFLKAGRARRINEPEIPFVRGAFAAVVSIITKFRSILFPRNGNRCFRWKRHNLRALRPDVTATLNRYSSVTTAMLYSTDLTKDTPSSKIMRVFSYSDQNRAYPKSFPSSRSGRRGTGGLDDRLGGRVGAGKRGR